MFYFFSLIYIKTLLLGIYVSINGAPLGLCNYFLAVNLANNLSLGLILFFEIATVIYY